MKIILIFVIVFLAYFSFGLLRFLIHDYDEAMKFIREGNTSIEDQWLSVIYTVLRHTPYNTYNDIRRLIKKIFKIDSGK